MLISIDRDAKVGLFVVLILVTLLIVVWGRQPQLGDLEPEPTKETPVDEGAPADTASTDGEAGTAGDAETVTIEAGTDVGRDPTTVGATTGGTDKEDDKTPTETEAGTPREEDPEPMTITVTTPPREKVYTVKEGDRLYKIARAACKDGATADEIEAMVARIIKLNDLADPNKIFPGQKLKVPVGGAEAPAATAATAKPRTHVVKEGESLSKIAEIHYKDRTKWRVIHAANKDKLPDPDTVKPGQVLVIPELPADN